MWLLGMITAPVQIYLDIFYLHLHTAMRGGSLKRPTFAFPRGAATFCFVFAGYQGENNCGGTMGNSAQKVGYVRQLRHHLGSCIIINNKTYKKTMYQVLHRFPLAIDKLSCIGYYSDVVLAIRWYGLPDG